MTWTVTDDGDHINVRAVIHREDAAELQSFIEALQKRQEKTDGRQPSQLQLPGTA